jgi:magnesium chelatase family protein
MTAVSCAIWGHDAEGTRLGCDIEVKCPGTLRPWDFQPEPKRPGFPHGNLVASPTKVLLFLDELPEFNRNGLWLLHQPFEEGKVTNIGPMNNSPFTANFILVAAMNPCSCGYRSGPCRACTYPPPQEEKYRANLRDLHLEIPALPFTQVAEMPPGPPSSDFRAQALAARECQSHRFGQKGPLVNGRMTLRQVRNLCHLKPETMSIPKAAMEEPGLSARG